MTRVCAAIHPVTGARCVGRTPFLMRRLLLLPFLPCLLLSCAPAGSSAPSMPEVTPQSRAVVLPIDAVAWAPLNPARGDASPRAANLWGDRTTPGATGFLVRFADGFASPPHIHNVSYRAVALQGWVHNDDPEAAPMWMEPGSFWTQPRGEAHITAARGEGSTVLAYVEIEEGPYLVRPAADAVEGPERALNIDASNLVWVETNGVRVAYLWGNPEVHHGVFVKVPAGSTAQLQAISGPLRAVVVAGTPTHPEPLPVGSLLTAEAGPAVVDCAADADCVFYVRSEGTLEVSASARES